MSIGASGTPRRAFPTETRPTAFPIALRCATHHPASEIIGKSWQATSRKVEVSARFPVEPHLQARRACWQATSRLSILQELANRGEPKATQRTRRTEETMSVQTNRGVWMIVGILI